MITLTLQFSGNINRIVNVRFTNYARLENCIASTVVDDEELTRTGLVSSIDWDSLGITEILQADDGVNGLEMAKLYKPEIILCDVRMPRMTGIAMLERLEKFLRTVSLSL